MEYNADLQDWDINYIRQVERANSKILRDI